MRRILALALVVAACGGSDKKPAKDDAAVPDAPPDAAMLPSCASPIAGSTVSFRRIGAVTGGAMLATSPPNDPRLFVLEQRGAIRIFKDEMLQPTPFLDLSIDATPAGPVRAGGEMGLLGLAFHPSYATNGQFFVFYTSTGALRDVVARCTVSASNPDVADRASCVEILSIPDFAQNHNGGMIEFGADGFLYIGTGDGGGGGDPQRVAQNTNSLLGKILRIDVDKAENGKMYGIPAGNPFAAGGGAPEVYIIGLRNPWRWSFDRGTGDMWIGDVGQGVTEEMTVLRAGEQAGRNLGWSVYEGNNCCDTQADNCSQSGTQYPCDNTNKIFPQDVRLRGPTGWVSIIAGQTYRGTCFPDLVGWHFYTDYGAADLVKARLMADNKLEIVDLPSVQVPANPASIHADARGELYLTTTGGGVYRLQAAAP